jgi:Arc/MetJ-type ribon-helix-helix transcriptional regulator
MAKKKVSITIEEENFKRAKTLVESGKYRNFSHVVDIALKQLFEKEDNKRENKKIK